MASVSLDLLVVNWQDWQHPRAGGAEVHLREIFGRLAAEGHRVTLLTSGWSGCRDRDVLDGIQVHRVGGRHSFAARAAAYHHRVLAHQRWDVIIEDLNKVPLLTPLWRREAPVALLVHHLLGRSALGSAPLPVAATSMLAERLLPLAYRDVPAMAVSESTADDLVRRGLRARDVVVIRTGLDSAAGPEPRPWPAGRPLLVYLGRLVRYKRVDVLLHAAALLRRRGQEVRVVVAGDGPERARLEALAVSLGLRDVVRFAGRVDEAEKAALLRAAWVHVLPSCKEGWGLTVLEAGALGTPTVASDAPGLRDAVLHDRTGVLVPPGDPRALADALRALLDEPGRIVRLGRQARAYARSHSWERAARDTLAFCLAVAEGSAAAFAARRAALRLRRRAPWTVTRLPRVGGGAYPYSAVAWSVSWTRGGQRLDLRAELGAADAAGRWPVLTLHGERAARGAWPDPPAGTVPLAVAADEVAWLLDGWPDDPVDWLAEVLRSQGTTASCRARSPDAPAGAA
jgi:glycosyltransferase involved in cell wall biosynthesis